MKPRLKVSIEKSITPAIAGSSNETKTPSLDTIKSEILKELYRSIVNIKQLTFLNQVKHLPGLTRALVILMNSDKQEELEEEEVKSLKDLLNL